MSKQYKRTALDALRGNWKTAILAYFVASLIGATVISGSSSVNFDFTREYPIEDIMAMFGNGIGVLFIAMGSIGFVLSVLSLIFGGAVRFGYASYNLNLVDGQPAVFHDLFTHMNRKWKGFCMNFFMGLYVALWSLLLVIPGIVKSFAYAMTPYIMAEHPEMTANDAIAESEFIMTGHKWELFCLHLSFLGWGLLAALPMLLVLIPVVISDVSPERYLIAMASAIPLGAGYLFLQPYIEAAHAAFYRDIAPKKEEPAADWYLPV